MEMRKARARAEGRELEVRWEPVPLASIPDHVERAVRVAEDAMFYRHHGIDWYEVWMSVEEWWSDDQRPRGASTITMQLARNLYLSPERSILRKARETLLALRLERRLSKARILELYLNVVELGPGVFGVEAAARHYWGTSVGGLGRREAAELAATLPSPRDDNPRTRTRAFLWRAGLIRGRAFGADTTDVDAAADTAAAEPAPSDSLPGGPLPADSVRPSLPGGAVGDTASAADGAG
jgi:monofunctional biosynthetic peptidoglycan transglycosylase